MSRELEGEVRARRSSGDLRGAAALALEAYGPEVLSWLIAITRDRDEAEEAFATAAEDFWRSLPDFRGECSVRTWIYVLARHALARQRSASLVRERRMRPLSEASAIVERIRSGTAPWQRTDVKDRFTALRDELPEQDRSLLILRVDRQLSWEEIATIVSSEGEDPGRVSARLRQRFHTIKRTLRERARELGLIDEK